MSSVATTDDAPEAAAGAHVADVRLLGQGQEGPRISADVVQAQSYSDCTGDPDGAGTSFVGLEIDGTPIENTPAPNTVIDLTVAKVILNEQHAASDGRGFV